MDEEYKNLNFGQALGLLGIGKKLARSQWNGSGFIMLQTPDENSKMTEPYIYFETIISASQANPVPVKRFPCVIGADSVLANDWQVVS